MVAPSFRFKRFGGGGSLPTSGECPMAEAQALALCVPVFCSRTSPQILGPLCTPAQSGAVCAQWLQPLKPQSHFCGLLQSLGRPWRPRGHRERIWRSRRSPSLGGCFKDRMCACKASPPLKSPDSAESWGTGGGGARWGGAGRGCSHQKAWKKDSTKAVSRNLGPESELCLRVPGHQGPCASC